MFGYVIYNESSLSPDDLASYKKYYCGLCRTLKNKYGNFSRLSLNFDLVFLAILLDSLYEYDVEEKQFHCSLHPTKTKTATFSLALDYASSISVLLTYYKTLDDWHDEHKVGMLMYQKILQSAFEKVSEQYPRQAKVIKTNLAKLTKLEQAEETNIDLVSDLFGEILGELFVVKDDEWRKYLYQIGFYLGKFIYLMDAYEDVIKDEKQHNYNVFHQRYQQENFADNFYQMMNLLLAEVADQIELLPLEKNINILRNIIYSGTWIKYNLISAKRKEQ